VKLFHWDRMEVLENYAPGDAIVMAETVEEARGKLRADFERYCRGDVGRWSYFWEEGEKLDPEYADLWREKLEQFERDIAAEPKIITSAIFITGSE